MKLSGKLVGFSAFLRSLVAVAALSVAWSLPLTTADAQDVRLCNTSGTPDPGDALFCVNDDGTWFGQLTMTSLTTATIAVRQLRDLACEAWGYDDAGSWVGNMEVTVDEGAADKCFYDSVEEACFDFSPIQTVGFACYIRR